MSAQEEIQHLINQYAFTIDTGDLEGFASLFEHGEWTMEGLKPRIGTQAVFGEIFGLDPCLRPFTSV